MPTGPTPGVSGGKSRVGAAHPPWFLNPASLLANLYIVSNSLAGRLMGQRYLAEDRLPQRLMVNEMYVHRTLSMQCLILPDFHGAKR